MVQTYVSRLRRSFGPDGAQLIAYGSGGYALRIASDQVDAHRFERLAAEGGELLGAADPRAAEVLRAALALWRGEVLADLDADFVRAAAARLGELRLTATENLYDAELRAGRHAAVVADLSDAVAATPLRERLRGLLAVALYRSGRQADALATLDEGRRILVDELGLDPSRDLRDLQSAILAQAPELELQRPVHDQTITSARPETERTAPGATPSPADRPDPFLIGRTAELGLLRESLAEVLAGYGSRYVVIDGEPGIGKTTLARALLHEAAEQGVSVRTTGTLEDGAAPAYGPWLALVRAARQRSEAVPDAFDRLLEGTGQVMHGAVPSAVASDVADSVAAQSAELAGSRGLLLLFEDLQWADPASLSLLAALGPRLGAARVLVVVTVRDLEIGRNDSVVETLAQLTRYVGTRRLTLRGLSRAESEALACRATGRSLPTTLVTALHDRSEGNPFFTTELARVLNELGELTDQQGWFAAVPTGVRDVLRRRLARLPPPTVALLEVAAVLGRRVDLGLLTRVAQRSLDDCLDDLEPALLTRLVVTPGDAPGSVAFTHALVRETLADQLTSLRRARLHLRAADGILASSGARDDTAEVGRSTCGRRPRSAPVTGRLPPSRPPRRSPSSARRWSAPSRCYSARPRCTEPRGPRVGWLSCGCCASSGSWAPHSTGTR